MKLKINTYTIASTAFSIISLTSFWIFSKFFDETLIFYLGVPFALSTFLLSYVLLRPNDKESSFKIAHTDILNIFLYTLTILSILAVALIPPCTVSILEWTNIPSINWFRYLASLLLTTFIPGYFLLKILDRKCEITGSIVIVLSYLLSLFTIFVIGFSILLSGKPIGSFGQMAVIAINLTVMIIYHLIGRKRIKHDSLTLNRLEVGLILLALSVVMVGGFITMINNLPLTPGDMQAHHGLALQYLNGFPIYGGMLIPAYPYLFHICLAVLFSLSGIPTALAEQGLYILSFMPVLAFYSAIKIWFSRKEDWRIPSTATLLSTLLGFGGLYAIYLKFIEPTYNISLILGNTTLKAYDIYMRVLYLPDIVAPIWNIGLPVFFTLLYFLRKDACDTTKSAIIPILVVLGYLGHQAEIILFIVILFTYTLLLKQSDEKKTGPYIMLGLIIVAIMDLAAPAQMFVLTSSGKGKVISPTFFISIFLTILTSVAEFIKDRHTLQFSPEFKNSLSKKLGTSWRYIRWILLYTYVFSFTVWLTIQAGFNFWDWGGYNFTPFFVFPLRLGVVGLVAIVSIFIYFSKITQDRRLLFFLVLLIPTGFILEQIANYYPLYPAYRFATLTFVGACIIATYGITRLISRVTNHWSSIKRKITVCALVNILLISGLLSTALYYVNASYYSTYSAMSQDEIDALDYIRQNTQTNSSASSDDSIYMVKQLCKNLRKGLTVKIIENDRNFGYCKGNNIGALAAENGTKYLVFLNNDTYVDANWLRNLVQKAESNSELGMVGSKIGVTREDLAIIAMACDYYGQVDSIVLRTANGQKTNYTNLKFFYCSGASLLVPKKVFWEVGGFDEALFMYHDDIDLCWRVRLSGYEVAVESSSVCHHVPNHSAYGLNLPVWKFYQGIAKNRIRVLLKNYAASNILKYFPRTVALIVLRGLLLSLVNKNVRYIVALFGGFLWNIKNLRDTQLKRLRIQHFRTVPDKNILANMLFHSIEIAYFKRFLVHI